MAYMRDHDIPYGGGYSQGGYNQQGGGYGTGNYSWDPAGMDEMSTSGQGNFRDYDDKYRYEEDYNESYNPRANENSYNPRANDGGNEGYEERYGNEWRGDDDRNWQRGQERGIGGWAGRGGGSANIRETFDDEGSWRTGNEGGDFYRGGELNRDSLVGNEMMGTDSWNLTRFMVSRMVGGYDGFGRGGKSKAKKRPAQGASTANYDTDFGPPSRGGHYQNSRSSSPAEDPDLSPSGELASLIENWQSFAKDFADCGNPISNMECSLKASKVGVLQLIYDCKFLTKCQFYNVFTGTLRIGKLVNNVPKESVFVARGLGLNKKNAKMDCYEQAYRLLMESPIEIIMSQKDRAESYIIQDIHHQYRENPKGFPDIMNTYTTAENESKKEQAGKRASSSKSPSGSKKARTSEFASDVVENKNLSLAPTKKVGVVMSPAAPLVDKLYRLKQLLKDEGITKLHIVPKIDQLAHKAAIHIQNVYRFDDVPLYEFDTMVPVYCELYFDDVFMARGSADVKRMNAMQQAYGNLARLLHVKPLEKLADNPRVWHPYMALDLDICNIVTKWHGKDNDSLLTSNLTNMKQMMQSMPDITIPVDKMVLTEHESDRDIENVFKSLELSATRNLMLLECETVRNPDLTFTCTLSLQGKVLASRTHAAKNGAKRLCSEVIMERMKASHDVIFVKTEMVGRVITQSELLLTAAKKQALGEPPAKIFKKITEHKDDTFNLSREEKLRQEQEREKYEERENLEENIRARPLFPWIAAAMYEILDEFYQSITLEDLMLDIGDMPKSQRDIVSSCAAKMGLRMVTKTKTSFDGPILRRTVTAQHMSKILQLHGGESGRYKLISCKNPLTEEELEEFRNQCLEQHHRMVEARINDNPDADPEPVAGKHESEFEAAESPSRNPSFRYRNNPRRPVDFFRGPQLPLSLSSVSDPYLSRLSGFPGPRFLGGPPRPLMGSSIRPLLPPPFYGRSHFNRY